MTTASDGSVLIRHVCHVLNCPAEPWEPHLRYRTRDGWYAVHAIDSLEQVDEYTPAGWTFWVALVGEELIVRNLDDLDLTKTVNRNMVTIELTRKR